MPTLFKIYKNLSFQHIEAQVSAYWKKEQIFQASQKKNKNKKVFTFFEGPPSANGLPGIHHVMGRAIKDAFCRYKTMKGFEVLRKGGWDTHGLPVELAVEQTLKIEKKDIGKKISIKEYNNTCKKQVMRYKNVWSELTEKMGFWLDLANPYITYENQYIESLWYLIKDLYSKKLIYKDYTVQPYSPAAGSGISSHELNQPGCYKMVKDTSIVAQFKVKVNPQSAFLFDDPKESIYFLAWTTTPWTLPSNCALAVGAEIKYVKVKTYNPYTFQAISIIIARDLVSKIFKQKTFYQVKLQKELSDYKNQKNIPYWICTEKQFNLLGKNLKGMRYEQLMPYVKNDHLDTHAFKVIDGDFVSTQEGTGIVHTASIFGADDFRVCKANNIPSVVFTDHRGKPAPLVDAQGKFVDIVSDFAGRYVKQELDPNPNLQANTVDVDIAISLKKQNKAFWVEKYEHSYPYCWRTHKPILYYPLESWFIKTTAIKDQLIKLNSTINWYPKSTGQGRFGNWLENLVDWNFSRSRFWGTPLPIWRTEAGQEEKCIGSIQELKTEVDKSIKKGFLPAKFATQLAQEKIDLHKPFVDDIILVSSKGKKMFREKDVVDVWFDSGAMPYAQWHYPFENKPLFEKHFPADFIIEGIDQTRGWFFTLHILASAFKKSIAFKNVISTGLVLDKSGNKMSKSKNNVIDPFLSIASQGADSIRWYLTSNTAPWDNLRFDIKGVNEVRGKVFGTLFNIYQFFVTYANIDSFFYQQKPVPFEQRSEMDRWIISSLHTLIEVVEMALENYNPTQATRFLQHFIDQQLSNWYLRLNRRRFWNKECLHELDKLSAFQTLYECLETLSKLIAPFSPFFAERLYKDLNDISKKNKEVSVHLNSFPIFEKKLQNNILEKKMEVTQKVCSMILSLRKKNLINVRQALSRGMVAIIDDDNRSGLENSGKIIVQETNLKTLDIVGKNSILVEKKIKPNFKKLGPKVGKDIQAIKTILEGLQSHEIEDFEKNKKHYIKNLKFTLYLEDVIMETKDIPGWQTTSSDGITVAIDTRISDELKIEGLARELVNKIQNFRKDKGFHVSDRIEIYIESKPLIQSILSAHKQYISNETLAINIKGLQNEFSSHKVLLDGQEIMIDLKKIKL